MASDADKLKAERLYIEAEKQPTDSGVAASCGIDRETVKRWRTAGNWEVRRAEYWRRATDAATLKAVSEQRVASVLTRVNALAILAEIAQSAAHEARDRINAIKAAAAIEQWGASSDDGDGPPQRLVLKRARSDA